MADTLVVQLLFLYSANLTGIGTTSLTFTYYYTAASMHQLFVQQTKHLTSSTTLLSPDSAVSYYMLNAQLFLLH